VSNGALCAEPIEGWRAWRLALDRHGVSLVPIGKGRRWPKQRAAAARCFRHRSHRAPIAGCTCGLYAANDVRLLDRARSPSVLGTVALWGTVIQHARGWRGEFAYPQRLRLVCHICLGQRTAGTEPGSVAAYRDGHLVALCERHLSVTRACGRDRFDVVASDDVLATLLDDYAVDRLPGA
jgi:hypothetical protein